MIVRVVPSQLHNAIYIINVAPVRVHFKMDITYVCEGIKFKINKYNEQIDVLFLYLVKENRSSIDLIIKWCMNHLNQGEY